MAKKIVAIVDDEVYNLLAKDGTDPIALGLAITKLALKGKSSSVRYTDTEQVEEGKTERKKAKRKDE